MGHYAKRFFGQGGGIPRDGLIREYLLNGNSFDTSGNGQNGSDTNITYIDDYAYFNGTNSLISFSQFNFDIGYTIAFTANIYLATVNRYYLSSITSNGIRYNTNNWLVNNSSTGTILTLPYTRVDSFVSFVFICERYDLYHMYANGIYIGQTYRGVDMLTINNIGRATSTILGGIKKLRVYNRTLTESEITILANE